MTSYVPSILSFDRGAYNLIRQLRQNPSLVFTEADKNLGLVALDLSDYHRLCLDHLNLTDHYLSLGNINDLHKTLVDEGTLAIRSIVNEFKNLFSSHERKFLLARRDYVIPAFHILPKIHKKGPLQGRPIAGAVNWVTTPAAKVLAVHLEPYVAQHQHILKDSLTLTHHLDAINNLPTNATLVSFDVVALYPSIRIPRLLKLLRPILHPHTFALLDFVLNSSFVEYNDNVFKQLQGIPMGTNAAVHIANLYLALEVDSLFQNCPDVRHYFRYIDDIFLIWTGTEEDLLDFFDGIHEDLFDNGSNISFTKVGPASSLDVLDINIQIKNSRLSYRTFQKPMSRFLYIPPFPVIHPISSKASSLLSYKGLRGHVVCI